MHQAVVAFIDKTTHPILLPDQTPPGKRNGRSGGTVQASDFGARGEGLPREYVPFRKKSC